MNKVTKVKSVAKKDLNPYNVGVETLKVMGIDAAAEFPYSRTIMVGKCCMNKTRIIVGTLNGKWAMKEEGMKGFKAKFIVVGKKVVELREQKPKRQAKTVSINVVGKMSAREIFSAGMYRPTRKCKSKVKLNDKIKNEQKRIAC